MPFTVQYAVPMTCEDCTKSIKNALDNVKGVQNVDFDLEKQLVTIRGDSAPSQIVSTMREIGRDAIVRGSGRPNSAAVCILENNQGKVRGLVRFIEDEERKIIIDCTVAATTGPAQEVSVHTSGDMSQGAMSTGEKLYTLGTTSRSGDIIGLITRQSLPLADIIGRSIVVGPSSGPTANSLAGVIARSAGVWENDKVVCSCTGMTLWEERKVAPTV